MSDSVSIFEVEALDCRYEPQIWAFATQNRSAIAAHWEALVADKPALFNGRVLLLHRWSIDGPVFRGAYLDTDYASFLAFRDFGFPEKDKRNCFAMAALRSREGHFLLGEMGAHTANAGLVYFAAGTPDLSDVVDGRVDLERGVMRELKEETGLGPREVTVEPGWTVVMLGPRIALMRTIRSLLASADLKDRIEAFLAREPLPELARMHVVACLRDVLDERVPPIQRAYLEHALGPGSPQRTG
jgi:hypothetical protein